MLFKSERDPADYKDPLDEKELMLAVLWHINFVWGIYPPDDILWACMNIAMHIENLYKLMEQVAIGKEMCPVISADGEHIIDYIPVITPK